MALKNTSTNKGFSFFGNSSDLQKRILFTLGVLIIYRLGTYIPIPGVNPLAVKDFFDGNSQNILGMFDVFSGGALKRMSVFALSIVPYIAASIMMQLFQFIFPSLKELQKEGDNGKAKLSSYTKYLTLVICIVQSLAIAVGLENMQAADGTLSVASPGIMFKLNAVFSLTAGTFFVLWMGERITEKGICNGVSLIIFSGIVSNLPVALAATLSLGEKGVLSTVAIIGILVMIVAVIYGVVFVETAQRRIPVRYPRRNVGNKVNSAETSYLPLKINNSGVIPPIFASSILLLPITLINFLKVDPNSWLASYTMYLSRGHIGYLALYALLIIFFSFFYVSIVFNPQETSDNLKKSGGVILGIRPGGNTSDFINFILSRITTIGAAYLVIICLLPEILISKLSVPFYFGGTSLLIIVSVTLDTINQIQSHVLSLRYQSLIKKTKLGRK
ncbi:preprotein translocase subunit SecY [Rickettsiales bacterium LUAb2]